ncbi:MAG: hypothetical protein Q8K01_14885 [Sulfurimicrobium sp.]|jgi:hypothetical protein|nr:hypothetical protein [Sulfurimicrobium sp.]MDP3688174.1 hypothetical protein [Sulfurimicrobium sp.]
MSNGQSLSMAFSTISLILTLGVSMSACAGLFGIGGTSWKEEVLLHDGRVLLVERSYNLGGYPTLDARERVMLDETITFTLPEYSQKVVWKADFDNTVPEPNSLGALLLGIVGGVPYLAASPAGCIAYNKWGRPNPPYILFKYVNDAWQQIPLKEFPPELIEANLMSMPASSLLKPYYTVAAAKAQRQNGNVSAYAKTILREAVKGGDAVTSCLELVPYKGKWIMPNDPIMKAIIDRESK